MAGPDDVKREWMKIFDHISQEISSFSKAQDFAIELLGHEGLILYRRFRGPTVEPLAPSTAAMKLFENWLQRLSRTNYPPLTFKEKKERFSKALQDMVGIARSQKKFYYTWEGEYFFFPA